MASPAMCDSGKKVITVTTLTISTRSLYKLRSLTLVINFFGRQLVNISVQAKRPHVRQSPMPKDENCSISKVVEP